MSDTNYELFLSFRNSNYNDEIDIASDLHSKFIKLNINCFYSNATIIENGKSDYLDLIDSALNSSKVLVLIASKKENVTSEFIKYEWKSFLNEILSNRKKGEIFILLNGITVSELPISLRSCQCFERNSIEKLVETVSNYFIKHSNKSNNFSLSMEDFNAKTLCKYSDGVNRIQIENFITDFLSGESSICYLTGETGIGISRSMANYVKKIKNNNVLYSDEPSELINYINNYVTDFKLIKVIFADNIIDIDTLKIIVDFAINNNIKLVCAISISLENLLYKVNLCQNYILYKVPFLTNQEIETYFKNAFSIENNDAIEICKSINMMQNNFIKKPQVIDLIISNIKTGKLNCNNFTITRLFELIDFENECRCEDEKLIEYLVVNKKEKVDKNQYSDADDLIKLENIGLLIQINGIYEYKNSELFKFKIAKYIRRNLDRIVKLNDFTDVFRKVIPFYIAYSIEINDEISSFNFDKLDINLIEETMDILFINEKNIIELLSINEFKKYIYHYMQINIENGYFDLVDLIITIMTTYNIYEKDELDSIKFLRHYYQTGEIKEYPNNKSSRYLFYLSMVNYFSDNYKKTMKYIKKALYKCGDNHLKTNMLIHYMDVLIDCGFVSKVLSLTKKINKEELSIQQSIHLDNILGYYYCSFGKYLDAINIYEHAIKQTGIDMQDNMIAKNYGDLAIVFIYLGKYQQAENYIMKNIEICRLNNNINGLCASNHIYGILLFLQKRYLESFKYFNEALLYSRRNSNIWRMTRIELALNIMSVLCGKNTFDVKEILFKISTIDSDEFWPYSYTLLALYYFSNGEDEEAHYYLSKSNKIINNTNELEKKRLHDMIYNVITGSTNEYSIYSKSFYDSYIYLKNIDKEEFKWYVPYSELVVDDIKLMFPSINDYKDVFDYASDFDTTKYMIWNTHTSIFDTMDFLSLCINKIRTKYYLAWTIVKNNKVIGMIDMTKSNLDSYEIGYIVSKNYWGQGIATKVSKKVIEYMQYHNINKFYGIAFEENVQSKHVLEKLGFKFKYKQENEDAIIEDCYILET